MVSSGQGLSVRRWGAAPALLFAAACFVVPLIAMGLVSFSQRIGGHTVLSWTLDNYRGFVSRSDGAFVDALFNSIQVTLIVTVLSVAGRLSAGLHPGLPRAAALAADRAGGDRAAVLDVLCDPLL